jgi:hypothetical protein
MATDKITELTESGIPAWHDEQLARALISCLRCEHASELCS